MPKIICIIGITGNQGGSVASRFLQDDKFHVRGLTRNPSSPTARRLSAQGVEIIYADLNDTSTLIPAFKNANIIFSVTNYWEPFFKSDCREHAAEKGVNCRRYAYDVELQQGKNIADAAATLDTLDDNGFIVSTLSNARKCSQGRLKEVYHFDAKADIFPDYVRLKYPDLAGKMSCIQTGFFMSSYKLAPDAYFTRMGEGFEMTFPTTSDAAVPHLDVNADLGNFVYAVSQMPPGHTYMAAGSTCSWTEYMRLWSAVTGVKGRYRQISLEEVIEKTPDKEFGREFGDMCLYTSDPGYGGGERLLMAEDIQRAGIECPMTSLEEWMKKEDWSRVLNSDSC